jgi:hypothetical protein
VENGVRPGCRVALLSSQEEAGDFHRHLTIILDGQVLMVPTRHSVISKRAEISDDFAKARVDRLVTILRGPVLAVPLKPRPLKITKVHPKKA